MKKQDLPLLIDYSGKVVVITGAGGVLCSKMAEAFALSGAKVAVLDLQKEKADEAAKAIQEEGGIAIGYAANCLKKEDIEAAHEQILKDLGPCDILINGAGGNSPKATTSQEFFSSEIDEGTISFFDLQEAGFQFVFNLNILTVLLVSQVFAKDMIGRKGCSILNISSMNAFTPLTKIPAYSSAKAGVSNFTQWLANYFAPANIRVNAVAPGLTNTEMMRQANQDQLAGRIANIALLKDLTADEIYTAVTQPAASAIKTYEKILAASGKVLKCDDAYLHALAQEAAEAGLGVRGCRNTISEKLRESMYKAYEQNDPQVYFCR